VRTHGPNRSLGKPLHRIEAAAVSNDMDTALHILAALAAVFIPLAFAYGCIVLGEKVKILEEMHRSLRR